MLLDTHIFLWLAGDLARIPEGLVGKIKTAGALWVSPVTFQEISIKNRKHPKSFPVTVQQALRACYDMRCQALSYSLDHVVQYDRLPHHHFEPYDRMLIAQLIVEQIPLVSIDPAMKKYEGNYETCQGSQLEFQLLS